MTPKTKTLHDYQSNAANLAARYESADVADLHSLLCKALPHPGKLLELGCGSGREAAFMVGKGHAMSQPPTAAGKCWIRQ